MLTKEQELDAELTALLTEPTAEHVRRKELEQAAALSELARALAPAINDVLADLHRRIKEQGHDENAEG